MSNGNLSEAKIRANRKWDELNRERKNYIVKRSTARNFVLKQATLADLCELEELILIRKTEL